MRISATACRSPLVTAQLSGKCAACCHTNPRRVCRAIPPQSNVKRWLLSHLSAHTPALVSQNRSTEGFRSGLLRKASVRERTAQRTANCTAACRKPAHGDGRVPGKMHQPPIWHIEGLRQLQYRPQLQRISLPSRGFRLFLHPITLPLDHWTLSLKTAMLRNPDCREDCGFGQFFVDIRRREWIECTLTSHSRFKGREP